jgi:Predicted oxidoreductases (related to aryl-alcohol dehydrogenases)
VGKEGNFIDTADMYSQWVEGHSGGESESIIGNWQKKKRKPKLGCDRD